VESILSKGLDRVPLTAKPADQTELALGEHENLRGRDYYH
jgi:hypothetical protein